MQRNTKQTTEFLCATTTLLVSTTLNATGIPPIDITLSSGVGSNTITATVGQTSIVEYKIQDIIGKLPARTWVWATPIPSYLTKTASLHQPDCSIYNQNPANPNAFTLPPNGSCYFAIQVNGTAFASAYHGTPVNYRPVFTNSNAVAYGPCDDINISLGNALLIAVGSYGSPSNTRPLLVQSQNGGTTWTYPQSTNAPSYPDFPDFTSFSRFSGTSCGSSTCIAVGSGEDAFTRAPILAMTQDGGNTWTYPQIIPPVFTPTTTDPFTRGEFNSSSCSGTVCIAVGDFNFNSPLLAFTQNSGTTWAFPDSVTTPVFVPGDINPYSSNGIFNSASCSGSTCIAVGQYDDINSILRPFLVLSQNSGTTWTYPDSTTSPTYAINPFDSNGLFSGASCSGSICVAVGAYNNVSNVQTPLLALSQNSGTTWSYPESISIPIFSPASTHPFVSGDFSSVSCSGTTCVAVGQYQDITAVSRPFLAVSQNSGASWSYPDSITSPTLTNPFSNGGFNSVSCLATNCVAVGQYEDTSAVLRPLMAISQNSGATWTYLDSISNPVLPTHPFDTNGLLSSVTCLANKCIAAGTYTDTSTGNRPLLALSLNSGVTWNYVDSITSPVFTPVDTNPYVGGGRFVSTAIGNTPSWMHPKIKEQKQSSFIFKR